METNDANAPWAVRGIPVRGRSSDRCVVVGVSPRDLEVEKAADKERRSVGAWEYGLGRRSGKRFDV